ncbi:restriction endonuclease subunit S [Fructobacillus parabroussonetiae]|uniref:Restriction endonuclease subunit S n=1 Tax=Fructobacillus parabroussonetiae TaxID=2713174 RepID=A0ABS5QWM8_9LACO|nr:restriction endonuclease subunit S [Fructobacillus parabroussonetiae]MBS9337202.1 restriction endonuclease subunit S [Fructobacillus parabroussonetiae]
MSNNVPQVRFNGYSDDWEERKLTDVTSSYSGLTYSPTDVQDKGTFVLRSSNVKNDQLIDADNVYVNPHIVNSNNVKIGDVIVVVRNGSRSLIGKHAIVTKEMPNTVIGAFMSAFRGENGDYINALLSTTNFQKEIHKSLGATINQITGKDFSMMNFSTPKLEEQSKIGSFFKQLDDTIALHQRKLDLLKEQKKGFLQKMFPKNGAKVPELRFAGFVDDWEERKLGDLLNKNSEKNKNLSVINVESVSNKTGFTKQTDQFEDYSVASADLSNYYVIREKQFAYNPSRINVGSIAYKYLGDEISVVSPLYVSFSTKKVLNDGFLWNWFKTASFDAQRQRLSEGGVRDTLSFNQLSEMNIMFPTYLEQEKIGSFFKLLDDTIAFHQRKLDLFKEQKKGFLQKMFV